MGINALHQPLVRGRVRHAIAGLVLPASRDESGFGLIETVLALVLLLVALVATASLVATGLKVGGNSRLKEVATDIASSALDCSVQQGGATLLTELNYGSPSAACGGGSIAKGGVTYTVEQDVTPGAGSCAAPQQGLPNELTVTDYVTWASVAPGSTWWTGSSATNKLVQEATYAAVPGSAINTSDGEILVEVNDASANGQGLVNVNAQLVVPPSPPTSLSATTPASGCVLFVNVTPGNWSITASRTGSMDNNENLVAAPNPNPVNVVAGSPTTVPLQYAPAATVNVSYTGANPPSNISSLPLSFYNNLLSVNPYVPAVSSTQTYQVYPFNPTSYTVVAGSCGTDSIPDNLATDGQQVNLSDGGTGYVTFSLTPIEVMVTNATGTPLSGASVTAQASTGSGSVPDTNCAPAEQNLLLALGSTAVQMAYHSSAGVVPEANLMSWSASSHLHASRSARRGQGAIRRTTDVQGSLRPRNRTSSQHRAVVLQAQHSGDVKRPNLSRMHGYAALTSRTTTHTTLTSSVSSSVHGQLVTFTATVVAASPGAGTPTGTITFEDGSTALHTGTLSNGVATYTTSSLAVGSKHSIAAVYGGDANYTPSTSSALSRRVRKTTTHTTLTSSVSSSVHGQLITFTATVVAASPGAGTPTGTVTFKDGSTTLHTGILSKGVASYVTSSLAVGSNHSITAVYGGDTNYTSSTSSALSRRVHKTTTHTTLTSSASSSVHGQLVTFTATVAAASSGAGTPTGTVTFKDGNNTIHAGTLRNGFASYATSSLAVGSNHSITAVYGGDTNYTPSTSSALSLRVDRASTTTTLTSSASPSAHGQSVTFTATVAAVSPGSGTPSGTVTFEDGSTTLHTGILSKGVASYTTSLFAVGSSHSITVAYEGDTNFTGSTSSALFRQVNQASTTTILTSSVNPSLSASPVNLIATVVPTSPGAGTPTGTVTFKDGSTTLHTGILSKGVASYATSSLAVGSKHSITAVYGGDTNFTPSTSSALSQVVLMSSAKSYRSADDGHVARRLIGNEAVFASWYGGPSHEPTAQLMATNTTTTLSSSANPSVYGQSVTFTATVTPSAATGTVTFKDGSTTLGTGTLSGGHATYATSSLSVATHSITAVYGGNSSYNSSTSGALSQVVNKASTTTTLSSSANPSVYGQSVTFTATVAAVSPGSGTPTTTVTFKDGSTTLGTGTLSAGVATYSTSTLAVGSTHSITAVYGGDTNFTTSTSGALSQVVNKASTTTTLSSSANPSVYGQSVTFTATVAAASPGSGTPTGTVTFKDGSTILGTGTLSAGVTTYSTSSLAVATHSITAVYGGDTNFTTSTSSVLSQVVNQASTTTTLTSSANPSVYGQSVTFTATVAAVSPGSGTPTGTVTFEDGGNVIGTGTLSAGQATDSTSTLAVGSHTITAVYGGATNFTTSTSSVVAQLVQTHTQTSLSTYPNPSVAGQSVTLTASVTSSTAPNGPVTSGTITFYDGATQLGGPVSLNSNGVATYTTSTLAVGSHTITAVYSGATAYLPSTSAAVSQVVMATPTIYTLSSLPYGTFLLKASFGLLSGTVVVTISTAGIQINGGAPLSSNTIVIPVS